MAKKKADFEALIARAKSQQRANKVWKPKDGDSLVGEVVKMKWIRGKGKDDEGKAVPYLSVTLKEPEGDLVVVNCGVTLQEEFELQEVKKGETIAIFYHGKEGRTGIYSLATERE